MTLPPLRPYRITCPVCLELSGIPWSVVTAGGGAVTVNLRCRCGHDWSATRVADQLAPHEGRRRTPRPQVDDVIELRRKADRRSAS